MTNVSINYKFQQYVPLKLRPNSAIQIYYYYYYYYTLLLLLYDKCFNKL